MNRLLIDGLGETIFKTEVTRKLTIDGVTKVYPVYKVKLDQLFYNNHNDRIATWVNQFKSEHGNDVFDTLSQEQYNEIIENFIVESNESAIEKTQTNLALVNQREPGVTLSDGRIIDGNRRFTCLRRLAKQNPRFDYFETIILDTKIENNQKQIKMLELSIQYGEEKKVDYNPLDRLVGIYQDLIESRLLTIEEYAMSTNEPIHEVRKKVELALLLSEFLEFIHLPKQYHVARDYQVVSVLTDLQPLLKKYSLPETQKKIKNLVFTNIMMKTMGDSRRFIRNLNSMIDTGIINTYMKDQSRIGNDIQIALEDSNIGSKDDIDKFVLDNRELASDLVISLDKVVLRSNRQRTRKQPVNTVKRSTKLLRDIDTNIFEKLSDEEKGDLKNELRRLTSITQHFETIVDENDSDNSSYDNTEPNKVGQDTIEKINQDQEELKAKRYYIAKRLPDDPRIICVESKNTINNLMVSIEFEVFVPVNLDKPVTSFYGFFIDQDNKLISDKQLIEFVDEKSTKITFTLLPEVSKYPVCYLALQGFDDEEDELIQVLPFKVDIIYSADFSFD